MSYNLFWKLLYKVKGVERPQLGEIYYCNVDSRYYKVVSSNGRGYKIKEKTHRGTKKGITNKWFMRAKACGILEKQSD